MMMMISSSSIRYKDERDQMGLVGSFYVVAAPPAGHLEEVPNHFGLFSVP